MSSGTDNFIDSVNAALADDGQTAADGTLTNAKSIGKFAFLTRVTTTTDAASGTALSAVKLPASFFYYPKTYTIRNAGAGTLLVFPDVADGAINGVTSTGAAGTAPYAIPTGCYATFAATGLTAATRWTTIQYSTEGKTPVKAIAGVSPTLYRGQSGMTFSVTNATGADITITLPAPTLAAGMVFKFIASTATFASNDVKIDAGAGLLEGSAVVDGASVASAAARYAIFEAVAVAIGDWIEVTSNGAKWTVKGVGEAAASLSFA